MNEKFLVSRDDDAINAHKKKLEELQPRFNKLTRLYNVLKLDNDSRDLPEIIKHAFMQCREQVRKGLPPALKDTNAVETILLNGEKEFMDMLTEMRKAGDLDYVSSFELTDYGRVEIRQASLDRFEKDHSIYLTDLKGKVLLEKVIEALNDFERYSEKTYSPGANLVVTTMGNGCSLNPRWHFCDRDKQGNLKLNLKILALFESNRIQ